MIKVRTYQRYRCGYCKKTGTEWVIKRHERICYLNPKRECDTCDSTGEIEETIEGVGTKVDPCPFCSTAKHAQEEKKKRESDDNQSK